mmetsp:Transcript_2754/g.6424  ORF Transcript_2754/g.6424 Transcript_2754/m.6424 type:complete len:216 (-) Transcript_2754:396-1043(-)
MHEHASLDARRLGEIAVAEAPPGQRLAVLEARRLHGNRLHPPVRLPRRVDTELDRDVQPELLLDRVEVLLPGTRLLEDDDLAARVDLLPLGDGRLDDAAGRQPAPPVVVDSLAELGAGELGGPEEPLRLHLLRFGLVPPRIEPRDAGAEVGALLVAGSLRADVLVDAVVDPVQTLDEALVDLEEHLPDVRVRCWEPKQGGHDLLSVMLVHEPRAG